MASKKLLFTTMMSRVRLDRVLYALELLGPLTAQELADECLIGRRGIMYYLDQLRAEGIARITTWEYVGVIHFKPTPMYGLGSEPDAPRPARKPSALTSQEFRDRLVADPEKHQRYLAKRRALDNTKRLVQRLKKGNDYVFQAQTVQQTRTVDGSSVSSSSIASNQTRTIGSRNQS